MKGLFHRKYKKEITPCKLRKHVSINMSKLRVTNVLDHENLGTTKAAVFGEQSADLG